MKERYNLEKGSPKWHKWAPL